MINVPIVRFCDEKCLKYHLLRASLTIHNTDTLSSKTIDETLTIIKDPLKCNFKVFYLSECKKYKNPDVGKTQTKYRCGYIIIKVLQNPSKLRNKKRRNYFTDIIYRMVLKVRTIGISQ